MGKYYIALDGGGTKLQGVLFDEDGRKISTALAGGINGNVHSAKSVQEHVEACIRDLFRNADREIPKIEAVYRSWGTEFSNEIQKYCPCGSEIQVGEGCLGALSCGITDGVCTLSGTGSDIFYVKSAQELDAIGGWGYLLGDDGSGVWIGIQAVRSMMRYLEKIEEGSYLHRLIEEEYKPGSPSEMAMTIYSAVSPPYKLGTFCKVVNRAAQAGDPTAGLILAQAGILLAESTRQMVEKHNLKGTIHVCTTGGVFQHCDIMRDAFDRRISERIPSALLHHAKFEPVVGCVIYHMVARSGSLESGALEFLKSEYKEFCIQEKG